MSLQNVCISFGNEALLEKAELQLFKGDRICLLGRNGAGKSTLLKIIAGQIAVDSGEINKSRGLRVALFSQDIDENLTGEVGEIVLAGLNEERTALDQFQQLTDSSGSLSALADIQQQIDIASGWDLEHRLDAVLTPLRLSKGLYYQNLSGGMKRRVLLAKTLIRAPDVLLLDEPTNHLDMETTRWLEEYLGNYQGTLLFISHDRYFLRQLANRFLTIDRGRLTNWRGSYRNYSRHIEATLEQEERQQALADKHLAREERWIRQGIKARRSRNEGRVRELERLRADRARVREITGKVRMQAQTGIRSGKIVLEACNLCYSNGGIPLIENLNLIIARGDRVGLIGNNGVGKTTLIKLLIGELAPEAGSVQSGSNIQLAYFDQLRQGLNPALSVQDNVGGGSDSVMINGKSKHIISYLQDFLFSPQRVRAPITALSGGERNRLLLAKLFTRPSNLLVMDEPTNDLDIETLDLLEEQLLAYQGALILVSHDRAFLDNVLTSALLFMGNGRIEEHLGGFSDWQSHLPRPATTKSPPKKAKLKPHAEKMNYREEKEFIHLTKRIEGLETRQKAIHSMLGDPKFYKSSGDSEQKNLAKELKDLDDTLTEHYLRWEVLADKIPDDPQLLEK